MKIAALTLSILLLPFLSGCLWVCRIPMLKSAQYSDAGDCTNSVYQAPIHSMCGNSHTNWPVYPLISIRVYMTRHLSDGDDIPLEELRDRYPDWHLTGRDLHNIKWQRRLRWAQYTVLWIGSPIDACVDTIILPYDLYKMLY